MFYIAINFFAVVFFSRKFIFAILILVCKREKTFPHENFFQQGTTVQQNKVSKGEVFTFLIIPWTTTLTQPFYYQKPKFTYCTKCSIKSIPHNELK